MRPRSRSEVRLFDYAQMGRRASGVRLPRRQGEHLPGLHRRRVGVRVRVPRRPEALQHAGAGTQLDGDAGGRGDQRRQGHQLRLHVQNPQRHLLLQVQQRVELVRPLFICKFNETSFDSFMVSMLFYLGAMQWVVVKIGFLLQASQDFVCGHKLQAQIHFNL